MPKKKEPLPKPVYPPIPDDWVFPDDLDKEGFNPAILSLCDKDGKLPSQKERENEEAEWISRIRNYCKENSVYPIHILDFYREHHTEKAP